MNVKEKIAARAGSLENVSFSERARWVRERRPKRRFLGVLAMAGVHSGASIGGAIFASAPAIR
jgi:hypothetical protein